MGGARRARPLLVAGENRNRNVSTGLCVVLVLALFFEKKVALPIVAIGCGFACFSLLSLLYGYLRGVEKMGWEALLLTAQQAFLLAMGAYLLAHWNSAEAASLAFLVSHLLAFLAALVLIRKLVKEPLRNYLCFRRRELTGVLQEAFPLAVVTILWVIYYRIDTVVLAAFRNMSEVGLYGGAYRLLEGLVVLPAVIMIASFPRLSRYGMRRGAEFYGLFNRLLVILVLLALGVVAVIRPVSDAVIKLVLGGEYAESGGIFAILLLAVLAIYPGHLVTQALIGLDLQKIYMLVALVAAAVNLFLNLLLIPRYGAKGAAWATVITESLITISCAGCILGARWRENQGRPPSQ
jgi:O-antigen/teichoic acid export membrane protein